MKPEQSVRECLYARWRRAPSRFTVPGALPVLFFGDILTARIATVGLNPSDQEYLDRRGRELDGAKRRFETLASLGACDRVSLGSEQCERAIQRMRQYYQLGKPIYSWFRSLDRVARGLGFSYEAGAVAHLDLVQEATAPTWSALQRRSPGEKQAILSADLPFLRWQLETLPLEAVICNGRTVFSEVTRLVGGKVIADGKLCRATWYVGTGSINGRSLGLVGWNPPLARPTGLDKEGEIELGRVLRSQLARNGLV